MFQVESETWSLRQELEAARQALRLQTARYRQVDATLSRKLEQKEQEVKTWKSLRDQQLSHLMRALMVLEARLRREQRSIRSLLGERDTVIRAQQLEISRLRKLLAAEARHEEAKPTPVEEMLIASTELEYDGDVKPDLISSLGINHLRRSHDKSLTPTTTDNEDSQSNLDSLQLSFYEIGSQPESLVSNLSTQSCNGDELESSELTQDVNDNSPRSPIQFSPEVHWNNVSTARANSSSLVCFRALDITDGSKKLEVNVHLESKYSSQKNILSPVKEEGSVSVSKSNSPAKVHTRRESTGYEERSVNEPSSSEDTAYQDCKPSPSTLLQEVRISGRNEYEDNPVLNCVNQILLRDQEEFLEEQRTLRLKEQEKSRREAEALNIKKLTKSTENLCLLNEQIVVQHSPVKGKVYPPLNSITSQDVTQQFLRRSLKDEIAADNYKSINNLKSPSKPSTPKETSRAKVVPPALPPKPLRLLQSRSKSLDQKTILNSILPHLKGEDVNALEIIKNHVPLHQPSSDNELYVISNSAIDDDLLQQLQGRRMKSCSDLSVGLSKAKPMTQPRDNIYAPVLSHPTHKPPAKPTTSSQLKDKSNDQKSTPKKPLSSNDEEAIRNISKQSPVKKTISPTSCIKVASPISSLINNVDITTPAEEESNGKKTSPSVSQIVRKFEVLGTKTLQDLETEQTDDNSNNIQKNFEEFRLDECDMDTLCGDGRHEGDGAETRLNVPVESSISYENFLEATGLSQKSIMTPSRLFSNHKSVMKPKDVKHRSRVKAAAVVDRCNNNTTIPVVRYWTEPFL